MRKPIVVAASTILALLTSAGADADVKVGVTAAVNPQAIGQPPTEPERVLLVGADNFQNEKITTGPAGQVQLLFVDGSSLSVGPDAAVTIDQYVYDPNTKSGKLAISASQGLLRLVGGAISKSSEITVTTPTMTAGIRGGIALIDSRPPGANQPSRAAFLFGVGLRVTAFNQTQEATRPGYAIPVPPGGPPQTPVKMTSAEISAALSQFQGRRRDSTAGGPQQQAGGEPTQDQALANSNVSSATGSNESPRTLGTLAFNNLPLNPNNFSQIQNILTTQQTNNQVSNALASFDLFGHFFGGNIFLFNSFNPFLKGNLSADPNASNNYNFTARVQGNTITFSVPNGSGGFQSFSLPFLPGQSYQIGGITLPNGTINSGTVRVTGDKQYFSVFGTFTSNGSSSPDKFGLFAGKPTTALPTSGVLTYSVDPKFDNIPFVNNAADHSGLNLPVGGGGSAVSPLVVRASPVTNPTAAQGNDQRMNFLQASLTISGTAGNQKFGLFGTTGTFFQEQNSTIAMSGGEVGYALTCSTCASTRIASGVASAQIQTNTGLGNAIYGPNGNYIVAIPDQVQGVPGGASVRTPSAQGQFPFDTLASQQTGNDKFFVNELTQNAANSGTTQNIANQSQTTQGLVGYTAGMIENRASNGSITNSGFGGTGPNMVIVTDAGTNRMAASFAVTDLVNGNNFGLQMGDLSGFGGGRSAFISDQIFAARDQITNAGGPTSTINGSTVASNNLIMINSNLVPIDFQSFAGPGVTACTCSFMQWGWWAGEVQNTGASNSQRERFLGTWVAGTMPSASQIPSTGTATYNGHFIATVAGAQGRYIAAGNFQQNWNFAAANGSVGIANFDRGGPAGAAGINLSGTVSAPGGVSNQVNFNGGVSGSGGGYSLSGSVAGSFFRSPSDPVAGVGGSAAISGTAGGQAYKAHGTFAAQR